MPTIREAINQAAARLGLAGVPDPRRDARWLMADALGKDGAGLMAVERDALADTVAEKFEDAVKLREKRKPLAQITGKRAFYGRVFTINETVLDPRPETECLIDTALLEPFSRVLDMGTGSGAILVTLLAERPGAKGVGTDISEKAILIAGINAVAHGVNARIKLPASDWWQDVGGRYDLIVSNPPYIASEEMPGLSPEVRDWEPREALTNGGDGLGAYQHIADGALRHLLPGGRLIVEIGQTQANAVSEIFRIAGLPKSEVITDLDGRDRAVVARR